MGKTQIGELFFKERSLRLPFPFPERLRLAISERSLRRLITTLIVLFLAVLGTALFLQLMQSRAGHLAEQNRLSVIYSQIVAQRIALDYLAAKAERRPAEPMTTSRLIDIVPTNSLLESRVFAVADTAGSRSPPACRRRSSWSAGKSITSVLSPNFVTDADQQPAER